MPLDITFAVFWTCSAQPSERARRGRIHRDCIDGAPRGGVIDPRSKSICAVAAASVQMTSNALELGADDEVVHHEPTDAMPATRECLVVRAF
jgi:hypothetical protein